MKFILFFGLLILGLTAQAEVSPLEVEETLNQMVKDNVISPEEALKAKIRMRSMNSAQWTEMNQDANAMAMWQPASIKSEKAVQTVTSADLDRAQYKQIQDDIKKMMPKHRD